MRPEFERLSDGEGIRIVDPIESAQFDLRTADAVDPDAADPSAFTFPVTAAASLRTEAVIFPTRTDFYVRGADGQVVAHLASEDDAVGPLPPGRYEVECTSLPVKLYLSVDGRPAIEKHAGIGKVSLADEGTFSVGVRSFHETPAGTVTVTDDVEDVMRGVSVLGSALKTTSPERSFPTLRGHPPLLERGDELAIPDGLEPADTGVEIAVPRDRSYVYPVASLAYYLGAEVVPGPAPLVRADGVSRQLDGPDGFEEAVARALKRLVLLDCVVRTEGYYPVDLSEREALEDDLPFDPAALYDAPFAERLGAYLDVPFEAVADHVTNWNVTADVAPTAGNVEILPFVVNDLAVIRCPGREPTQTRSEPAPLSDFYRDDPTAADEALVRSAAPAEGSAGDAADPLVRSAGQTTPETDIVKPADAETPEHVWAGDGYPLGANKATTEAYRRRLDREAPDTSPIEIHVVCNDERMAEEGVVNEIYGLRDMLEFDVNVHFGLTRAEVADLLTAEFDLLHYIGHVDDEGMACTDGKLDARTLDEVNVRAFLLNACRSYEQGEALVDLGSYAGIVTLAEVGNSVATRVGRMVARLLNAGFTLRAATAVVQDQILTGYRYIVLGDGGARLVQSEDGIPVVATVECGDDRSFLLRSEVFPPPHRRIGTLVRPVGFSAEHSLDFGIFGPVELSEEELASHLALKPIPVRVDGDLYWSDETDVLALFD